jgi:hypothetical protein
MYDKGPPADETSYGNNKWRFEGKSIDIGTKPGAVNGEQGEQFEVSVFYVFS